MFIFALSMPTSCRYTWIVSLLTKNGGHLTLVS